jgi:hypothetical protein
MSVLGNEGVVAMSVLADEGTVAIANAAEINTFFIQSWFSGYKGTIFLVIISCVAPVFIKDT